MPPETLGSLPGAVAAGRDREVRGAKHNWPSVVWVREGLTGRDILVSSSTSEVANQGRQVHSVSFDTLASGLDERCVKK